MPNPNSLAIIASMAENRSKDESAYPAFLADNSSRLIAFPSRLMPSSVSSGGWLTKFSRRK
jgi:hypothetical protein